MGAGQVVALPAVRKPSTKSKKATGDFSNEQQIEKLLHDLSADPRLLGIVSEFEPRAKTASRKFGSNCLKVNRKLLEVKTRFGLQSTLSGYG